jgi:hypothetical protein
MTSVDHVVANRVYEVRATLFFPRHLDDGMVQDVITAVTLALQAYGGSEIAAEMREVHFGEGR